MIILTTRKSVIEMIKKIYDCDGLKVRTLSSR